MIAIRFDITDFTPYPEYQAYRDILPAWRDLSDKVSRLRTLLSQVRGESMDKPTPTFTTEQLDARARMLGYDWAEADSTYARFAIIDAQKKALNAAWSAVYVTLP